MNYPYESLICKLWETIAEKGIGSLLKPWQMKREAAAQLEIHRNEVIDAVKLEHDVSDLKVELTNERTKSIVSNSVVIDAIRLKAMELVQEQVSIAKALIFAEERIISENMTDESPKEKPTQDWLNKWKRNASTVTDEEILKIWGRILAGETSTPGKFQPRFLDFMNSISKSEAALIMKLSENCIEGSYYTGPDDNNGYLSFGELLQLQEIGVLQGVEAIGFSQQFKTRVKGKYETCLFGKGKMLIVEKDDENAIFKLDKICKLTSIGVSIVGLCNVVTRSETINQIGNVAIKQGFNAYSANYVPMKNGMVQYSNKIKIGT